MGSRDALLHLQGLRRPRRDPKVGPQTPKWGSTAAWGLRATRGEPRASSRDPEVMKEDPKGTEGPTAPKWIPMTSNGDPSWVPVSSDRDPTASKWIPISNRDPAVTKEDPPSSNETPAAERDPKAPPEGRPVEQPDPTAAPDPKASKWIPAASNGDREATRRNPKPCSGDPTAEPDPEASNCAPMSSNWAPSAALRGPTSTSRDPPAQPNPGQHRGADWDPAAPMEEDQDPTTHRVHPAAEPSPEQHHGEEWDPSPPMGPSPPMDPSAPMEEDQDPTTHPVRPTAEPVPAPYRDPPGTEEAPPLPMAAVEAMLAAVAASPVRVRSQQQGDPELTAAERHGELRALFLRKPLVFLERFHGALRPEHLPCFAHLPPSYEVAFYCRRVRERRRHNPETGASRWPRRPGARTRLRNRRYAALRQLIAGMGAQRGGRGVFEVLVGSLRVAGLLMGSWGSCEGPESLVGSLRSKREPWGVLEVLMGSSGCKWDPGGVPEALWGLYETFWGPYGVLMGSLGSEWDSYGVLEVFMGSLWSP